MNNEEELPEQAQGQYPPFLNPYQKNEELLTEQSLKYQLSADEIIEDLKNILLGRTKITNQYTGEVTYKETGKKTINKNGFEYIEMILRAMLTKIFKLTKLDEDVIKKMTIALHKNIVNSIYLHHDDWGVRDPESGSTIAGLVTNTVYATLCAAANGEYLLFLKTTYNIQKQEMSHLLPQQQGGQKPGLTSRIRGLFSR